MHNHTNPPTLRLQPCKLQSSSNAFRRVSGTIFMLAAVFSALLASLPLQAQNQGSGTITGKVISQKTGLSLMSAQVYIDSKPTAVITDSDGVFRFPNVAAGTHTIRVTYTDLDPQTQSVDVVAGATATLEFAMFAEIYQLEKFVVASEREGQAAAIQRQRQSSSMVNVVASDAFGNLIDTNAGELLKNLPGVFVNYDGEDVGGFNIRGIGTDGGTVTMDGNSFANSTTSLNAEPTRGVSLKNFSVASIESVEVYKVPPPSSPANANGGVVNMVTKNAFDQKGRRLILTANMNLNSEALNYAATPGGNREPDRKWGPGFNLFYSEAFLNNRLGISLNLNAYQFYRFNDTLGDLGDTYDKLATDLPTKDTPGYISDYRITEAASKKQNRAGTLNIDYKLARHTAIYLKTSYNDGKNLSGYSQALRLNNGNVNTKDSDFYYRDTENARFGMTVGGAPSQQQHNEAWSINPGVKHTFDWGKIDYDVYTSRAFTKGAEGITSIGYNSPYGHYILTDARSKDGAIIEDVNPVNGGYLNLDNYTDMTLYTSDALMVDEKKGGKINIQVPVSLLGYPLVVSAGGLYSDWERNSHNYQKNYTLNTGAATPGYSEFYDPVFGNSSGFSNTVVADWISPWKVADYFADNPSMFTLNQSTYNQSLYRYTRTVKETITAGYLMGSWQINNFNVLGGFRYEHTKTESTGFQTNNELSSTDPAYYTMVTGERSYGNFFPNVQLKYEPFKNLILRAAWTNTIGRPNLNYLIPNNTIAKDSADKDYIYVTVSNTDLKPQRSMNYDLNVEYYFPHAGVASFGVFRKEMKDYILTREGPMEEVAPELMKYYNPDDYDKPLWVTTAQNVGTATMEGFELSYRQQLRFLPSFLKNFDVYGTFSYITPDGDIPLENVKTKVASGKLTYRAKNWMASVGYFWSGEYLRRNPSTTGTGSSVIAGTDGVYVQPAGRWDMSVNYQFSSIWSLSFDWRNFTNEPDSWKRYDRQVRYFKGGTTMNLVLKANL